jgi:hypothetical protein
MSASTEAMGAAAQKRAIDIQCNPTKLFPRLLLVRMTVGRSLTVSMYGESRSPGDPMLAWWSGQIAEARLDYSSAASGSASLWCAHAAFDVSAEDAATIEKALAAYGLEITRGTQDRRPS